MGLRFAIFVVTLLLSAATTDASVAAQDVAADALLEQGLALRERGEHARALVYFQRAYELEPSPRALAQIALANQALQQWLVAYQKLTEALTHTNDSWIRTRRQALETALASARAHVGFLDLAGGIPNTRVFVNGVDAGSVPVETTVVCEPGLVHIELRAGSQVVLTRDVPVEAGQLASVQLPNDRPVVEAEATGANELGVGNARSRQVDAPPPSSSSLPVIGWTSAALGVAGIATGVVFQLTRESAVSAANSCVDQLVARSGCSESEWRGHGDDANQAGTISTISYIAGGALAITGVVLILLAPSSPSSSQDSDSASIACAPSLHSWGAECMGRF